MISDLSGSKVTVMSSLEQMMSATRSKILELKSDYVGSSIILVGFNTGAALACQVSLLLYTISIRLLNKRILDDF
jgi:regulatory NSL complex subunit 3